MHPFLPILVLIFWTFIIGIMTGKSRADAIKQKRLRIKDVALGGDAWPDDVKKWGNNFNNLFEVPMIFYVVMLMAAHLNYTPQWFMIVAWGFVAMRILHSVIHVTKNNVNYRFMAFMVANLLVGALAIGLFLRLS